MDATALLLRFVELLFLLVGWEISLFSKAMAFPGGIAEAIDSWRRWWYSPTDAGEAGSTDFN